MTRISANQNLPTKQDPDTYAKTYATQNGISVDAAKTKLKELYGDPMTKQQDESIFNQSSNTQNATNQASTEESDSATETNESGFISFIRNLFGLSEEYNIAEDIELDPDTIGQKYADPHTLRLDEAKNKLGEMYGDPLEPNETEDAQEASDTSADATADTASTDSTDTASTDATANSASAATSTSGSAVPEGIFKSYLKGKEGLVTQLSNKYGVDPILVSSIIALESGWGVSELASHNNFMGLKNYNKTADAGTNEKGFGYYSTAEKGLEAAIKNLSTYAEKFSDVKAVSYDNIYAIATHYCVGNTRAGNVKDIYAKIKSKVTTA